MSAEMVFNLMVAFLSLSLGILLGIFRSKIFSKDYNGDLYRIFIVVFLVLAILVAVASCLYWNSFTFPMQVLAVVSALSGLIVAFFAKKYMQFKNIFKSEELDPIVNKFTDDADRTEIKLFGGDLNFFGEAPDKIEENNQYTHLRKKRFNRILILCEKPSNNSQKMRYGKILNDMPYTRFGFYHPELADLKVRGRISQVQGVNKLLIYTKVKSKRYRAIETDTSDSDGQRYLSIWVLVWSLSEKPTESELKEYKSLIN